PIPEDGQVVAVKVRSTRPPVPARVFAGGAAGQATVILDDAETGVSPGQACVFYDGTRVLGGGWIRQTRSLREVAAAA
ncbi:MAG: tRNA 2-thiouridine(34) synthase MnmA, partial [Alphaproteobacteria bacterium]